MVAGAAFKLLFKTYFTLQGVSRAGPQPAPRARWTFSVETPRNEWRGRYALPVPEAVSDLPEKSAGPMPVAITTWRHRRCGRDSHVVSSVLNSLISSACERSSIREATGSLAITKGIRQGPGDDVRWRSHRYLTMTVFAWTRDRARPTTRIASIAGEMENSMKADGRRLPASVWSSRMSQRLAPRQRPGPRQD